MDPRVKKHWINNLVKKHGFEQLRHEWSTNVATAAVCIRSKCIEDDEEGCFHGSLCARFKMSFCTLMTLSTRQGSEEMAENGEHFTGPEVISDNADRENDNQPLSSSKAKKKRFPRKKRKTSRKRKAEIADESPSQELSMELTAPSAPSVVLQNPYALSSSKYGGLIKDFKPNYYLAEPKHQSSVHPQQNALMGSETRTHNTAALTPLTESNKYLDNYQVSNKDEDNETKSLAKRKKRNVQLTSPQEKTDWSHFNITKLLISRKKEAHKLQIKTARECADAEGSLKYIPLKFVGPVLKDTIISKSESWFKVHLKRNVLVDGNITLTTTKLQHFPTWVEVKIKAKFTDRFPQKYARVKKMINAPPAILGGSLTDDAPFEFCPTFIARMADISFQSFNATGEEISADQQVVDVMNNIVQMSHAIILRAFAGSVSTSKNLKDLRLMLLKKYTLPSYQL